jgi:hypothetical protein
MRNDKKGTVMAEKDTKTEAAPDQRPQLTLRYVDRPELGETFADSIGHLSFDGQSLRIEFAITRMDDVKQGAPLTGRRYPACRLVLPPGAAVELINRMQQVAAALTQAGVLRQNPPAPPSPTASAPTTRN